MKLQIENKQLTFINFMVTGYFIALYGLNYFEIESNTIAFIGELLTIPFILAAIIFSAMGIKKLITGNMDLKTGISSFLLIMCTGLILFSFIR
ncbi:MAG: hypothetical protein R3283_07410 [Balneolaceae bacterium]|nr:hypothetical protein [Balneolaceae bacterium]